MSKSVASTGDTMLQMSEALSRTGFKGVAEHRQTVLADTTASSIIKGFFTGLRPSHSRRGVTAVCKLYHEVTNERF